jgi:ABC-type sugar transport system ATPase subunit/ribose/xylose/arabinose/galactoside ABC-type transport system permease subunit
MSDERPTAPLALTGVWKRYPGVVALKDVSFSVTQGEIHALLGENGAGKTTLMGVASGSVAPDEGTIEIGGEAVARLTPVEAHRRGLAIVHQEPALLPDLTVLENMVLAVPRSLRPSPSRRDDFWARAELDRVGCGVDLSARIQDIGVANRQLIELAKAFSVDPRVLILDEPTAPLGAERVTRMFELVRAAAANGTAVVYISHRLPEVRQIADRVTVMRDGAVRGTFGIQDVSDQDLVELIVGRALDAVFPPKSDGPLAGDGLQVLGASGTGFADVSIAVRPGEIVGLAGVAGNGQTEFLRSLAGLSSGVNEIHLDGNRVRLRGPASARGAGISYVSADRHHEGVFRSLSVRENAAISALPMMARGGVVRRKVEVSTVEQLRRQLNVRTPSIETGVASLSGGNQQKVVIARSMAARPGLLLVDEPTQGVDAGARVEIYVILRRLASEGIPVVVLSSDGLELEGLCDRVYVFSRGTVVAELAGDAVTERGIARQMVMATTHRRDDQRDAVRPPSSLARRLRRFAGDDWFPSLVLVGVMALLGAYTYSVSPRVLSEFNIGSALTLLSALALVSMGQSTVIMTGGIDISVGPLAGLLVVIASYFVVAGSSDAVIVAGLAVMLLVALGVGSLNGIMVRFGRFTPVAATLTTYIALQGISLLLRPVPGGSILQSVADVVEARIGPVPVAFLLVLVTAVVAEYVLRRTRPGLSLRAVGSSQRAAHRLGVRVSATVVLAYIVAGIFVFCGSVMLMAQIGIGDPVAGVEYTLWSVTAVVLGGASLFGARGSYIGTLLGAALIQQILNATVFLRLDQEWQFWLLGLLTLGSAGVYSQARRVKQPA